MRFTLWYDFSIFISYLRYFALRLTKPNLDLPCALTCAIAKPNLDFSKLGFLVSDSFQIFLLLLVSAYNSGELVLSDSAWAFFWSFSFQYVSPRQGGSLGWLLRHGLLDAGEDPRSTRWDLRGAPLRAGAVLDDLIVLIGVHVLFQSVGGCGDGCLGELEALVKRADLWILLTGVFFSVR